MLMRCAPRGVGTHRPSSSGIWLPSLWCRRRAPRPRRYYQVVRGRRHTPACAPVRTQGFLPPPVAADDDARVLRALSLSDVGSVVSSSRSQAARRTPERLGGARSTGTGGDVRQPSEGLLWFGEGNSKSWATSTRRRGHEHHSGREGGSAQAQPATDQLILEPSTYASQVSQPASQPARL
jgi:hypothetical protein